MLRAGRKIVSFDSHIVKMWDQQTGVNFVITVQDCTSRYQCLHAGRKIVSSDSHIVKMWDQQTGVNFTNIEPAEGGLNDICLWKDSGLIMLACDAPKIQVGALLHAKRNYFETEQMIQRPVSPSGRLRSVPYIIFISTQTGRAWAGT